MANLLLLIVVMLVGAVWAASVSLDGRCESYRTARCLLRAAAAMSVALASAACGPSAEAPQPLEDWQAKAAQRFLLDVTRCLYGLEHASSISELPVALKADLRPASTEERSMFQDPATKVWTNDTYGRHIVLAERTADQCEVNADQLPVEATFAVVRQGLQEADPELKAYPIEPGYDPIAYQLERVENGSRFIVRLEGSEPGGLGHPMRFLAGHAYRFSLLYAKISRQPESAPRP